MALSTTHHMRRFARAETELAGQTMSTTANNGFIVRDAATAEQASRSSCMGGCREKAPDNQPQLVIIFGA